MFTIKRSINNPILSPIRDNSWETAASFNPSPAEYKKKKYLVYRALSEPDPLVGPNLRISSVAVASSSDGIHYNKRSVLVHPDADFDAFGAEDPRVTKFNGKYYIFYTALGGFPFSEHNIKVAVAISRDLKNIEEKHLVTPFNAKAMGLFPELINGKMAALVTVDTDKKPSNICFVDFNTEEELWSPEKWNEWYPHATSHALSLKRNDDDHVELGSAPLKTDKGWLVLYSHIQHYGSDNPVFGVEAILLDLKNPELIIGRTRGSIMIPEEYYERIGMVRNIIFPSGAHIEGDQLEIYYGASDTHGAVATVSLEALLNSMIPHEALLKRYAKNPIIAPRPNKEWEVGGTINAATIELQGKIYIIYRAVADKNVSTFGCAVSTDGFTIDERFEEPIYRGKSQYETNVNGVEYSGAEDPRVSEIGDRLYFSYTAYNGKVARVAVISILTKDFINRKFDRWSEPSIISPDYIDDKDSCIIPEKFDGKYMVFHRIGSNVCADFVDSLDFRHPITRCIEIFSPRPGMWDGVKVGIAAPPIKTKKGWLLFYHGISDHKVYRVGALLLDLKNPTQIISRGATPILEPEKDYEMSGVVPHVVFPCGVIVRKDKLFMYYGAGDTVIGVATGSIKNILKMFE